MAFPSRPTSPTDSAGAGEDVTKLSAEMGHVIGIHTGSDEDHAPHTNRAAAPAYDVDGDTKADGTNGLESDLIRAKARIKKVIGAELGSTSAVGLKRNEA